MNHLVTKLYKEAESVADETIEYFQEMPLLDHLPQIDTLHIFTVKANESGYVEYINFNRLVELSKEFKGTIVLHLRIGEFIPQISR